ncbi:mitochondrial TOM complex subunit Tom40 [Schizosaccharomyces osmophilus]|uniref:Mitochondrial TOM complex subunit Tom40 n=1 Tax=Schizosaccharomyces osmophilus TaxID=2545709 RepID=A0AAE9WC90_9SCHI|nr:mitochondrial TOM complex subunit Tom40 [Schizosaccharomyces osmophilus]WBW72939.1 mitochondrial TOM complex subunit Tom40 [Schizosaccharomyces osmophilus]
MDYLQTAVSSIGRVGDKIDSYKSSLNLSNPGTTENLSKEVSKDLLLSNYAFTGIRADVTKGFSTNPWFTVSHAFALGSQMLPPYSFSTMFGGEPVFLRGSVDNDGALQAMLNCAWSPNVLSKVQMQLADATIPSMCQIEHDHRGKDFSFSVKAMNPWYEDKLTGIYILSMLQSLTPKLSMGVEALWQKPSASIGPEEAALSYMARYNAGDWIATGHLNGTQGDVTATFWRKLSEKVEAGVECQLSPVGLNRSAAMMIGPKPEGLTSVGLKYEFAQSIYRSQVDSKGKVGVYLERRLAPAITLAFSSEIDHPNRNAKVGLGLSMELPGSDEMIQQQQQLLSGQVPAAEPATPSA